MRGRLVLTTRLGWLLAPTSIGLTLVACNALTGASDLGTCADADCVTQLAPVRSDGGIGAGDATVPEAGTALPASCTGEERACSGNVAAQCANGQWQKTTCPESCAAGTCTPWPSCRNAAGTACGSDPAASSPAASCCATAVVPGGTYARRNQPSSPAVVSPFQLDLYEVTVGRFRAFVDAGGVTKAMPPAPGVGAHPKIANSGWQAVWNVFLPDDAGELRSQLTRFSGTWTDAPGANEHRPINHVSWFVAFAFCAWDGARLPTYAEWNFAAAGGSEQRVYPWSAPASSTSITAARAAYDCGYAPPSQTCALSFCSDGTSSPCDVATCIAPATCQYPACTGCALADVAEVGKLSEGAGRYGHFDLAGNVGELVLDVDGALAPTCTDCARLPPTALKGSPNRPRLDAEFMAAGGGWSHPAFSVRTSSTMSLVDTQTDNDVGFRCAR